MKVFTYQTVACLILVGIMVTGFLIAAPQQAQQQPTFKQPVLDLKTVVEILSDYSVEHQSVINGGQNWGLTDFKKRKIYISDEPDAAARRLTVLHELLHAAYFQHGVYTGEPEGEAIVDSQSKELFYEMWGIKD